MAVRRRSASGGRRRLPDAAFLNVPYDAKHEELFLAFLAGLSGFALIPRATLEIPGSQRRLDRIVHLLRCCRYSFHDLSRVELDPTPPATPRFNMPFELGLAVALEKTQRGRHEWLVFEMRPALTCVEGPVNRCDLASARVRRVRLCREQSFVERVDGARGYAQVPGKEEGQR